MKPLSCNPAKLKGLSEKLILSHFENNYGGAVKRLNSITAQLDSLDFAAAPVFVINGLKREELIASNSMILHELYFDGLGNAGEPDNDLRSALIRDFGSIERWQTQFATMGKALGGGSGASPILALDMYEHSYQMDYGAKAAAYVDAFMNNIKWETVSRLFAEEASRWTKKGNTL